MRFFFSPKSRIAVSRPLAICMNTLNMLGPALLLCALLLMLFAHAGQHPDEIRHLLLKATAALVAAALAIRIAWGICIRRIAARHRQARRPGGPCRNEWETGGSVDDYGDDHGLRG